MGIVFKRAETFTWEAIKWTFIAMTLVKLPIVLVFMLLGEEKRNLKMTILIPYLIFAIYLIFILLTEGFSHMDIYNTLH